MFFFIPMAVEGVTVRRIPWVSISIAALTVLAFLLTWPPPQDGRTQADLREAFDFWSAHPYLELSPKFQNRFLDDETQAKVGVLHQQALEAAPASFTVAEEQGKLDALIERLLTDNAYHRSALYKLSMVPERGVWQVGLVTSMFLHFGWMHLLFNLLFFYIAGVVLEDLWGRPLFAGFYLVGGVVATLAQTVLDLEYDGIILGASGAVAACMGAFTLRLATTKIRIGYFVWLYVRFFRGTFLLPAWACGMLWALGELKDFLVDGGAGSGTAVMAHLGGFGFGVAFAYGLRVSKLEERYLSKAVEREHVAYERDPRLDQAEQALLAGHLGLARTAVEALRKDAPDNLEAVVLAAKVELQEGNRAAADALLVQAFQKMVIRDQPSAVWSSVEELGAALDPKAFAPALAFKIATEIERGPDGIRHWSERFYARAGEAGGTLGAKGLLRAAEVHIAAFGSADTVLEYAARVRMLGKLTPELEARLAEVEEKAVTDPRLAASGKIRASREVEVPDEPLAPLESEPREPDEPRGPVDLTPRITDCRLTTMDGGGLVLEVPGQAPRKLGYGELLAVSVAAASAPPAQPGGPARNLLFTDFVLSWGDPRGGARVLRVPSHALGLARLYPALTTGEAYAEFLKTVLDNSGATTLPAIDDLRKGAYPRFKDVATLNATLYGAVS